MSPPSPRCGITVCSPHHWSLPPGVTDSEPPSPPSPPLNWCHRRSFSLPILSHLTAPLALTSCGTYLQVTADCRSPLPPSNATGSSWNRLPAITMPLSKLHRPLTLHGASPLDPLLPAQSTLSSVGHQATASCRATVPAMGTVTTPSARACRVPLAWATWPLCGRGLSLGGPRSAMLRTVSAVVWANRLRSVWPFGLPGATDRAVR
jgi:hypothetical protein